MAFLDRWRTKTRPESTVNPECVTVSDRLERDEAVLLDKNAERFYGLNETATFLWNALRDGMETTVLIHLYCQRYGVDESSAANDVKTFREELRKRGLLQ